DPLSGRDLAAFVAAVETGRVQGAADALYITQSAATKRILALERRLGTTLLERTRTGVRPTAAGERLYPSAREAVDALAVAKAAVADGGRRRMLRLAASLTIGEVLLPGWIEAFRRHHDPLTVQVEQVNSAAVIRRVRDG